jgi:hypothetical protein
MQIIEYKKGNYIKYGKYKERQARNRVLTDISVLVILAIIGASFFKESRNVNAYGVVFWLILFVGFFWILIKLAKIILKKEGLWLNWLFGERGERDVLNYLNQRFDDSWYYIDNFSIPGIRMGNIDGILIGKKGVFLLEIKRWLGDFKVFNNMFYRVFEDGNYYKYKRQPINQLVEISKLFIEYLENKKETHADILPIVVVVRGKIKSFNGSQETSVVELNQLQEAINYANLPELSQETIYKLVNILVYNKCPRCGGKLVRIHGRGYADFWGCSNYKNGCLFKEEVLQA